MVVNVGAGNMFLDVSVFFFFFLKPVFFCTFYSEIQFIRNGGKKTDEMRWLLSFSWRGKTIIET